MNWFKRANVDNYSLVLYMMLRDVINNPDQMGQLQNILHESVSVQSIQDLQTALQIAEGRIRSEQGGDLHQQQFDLLQQIQEVLSGYQGIEKEPPLQPQPLPEGDQSYDQDVFTGIPEP